MQKIKIEQIKENKIETFKNRLSVNVIHNRFDIKYGNDFDLYKINDELYIPVKLTDETLHLGIYFINIQYEVLEIFIEYLFKKYEKAKFLEFSHANLACFRNVEKKPHWHVNLPETIEEFDKNLHSKTRYNTKWYPKKIKEDLGEYSIKHYPKEEITKEIVDIYLQYKYKTHKSNYYLKNSLDYLDEFYVTDCYTLNINNQIEAILFLSNTGDNSYLENLTYNIELSKYSLGTVLYHEVIKDLISKKYKKLFLLGGTLEYKKRFNGVLTNTITATIKKEKGFKIFLSALAKNISCMPQFLSVICNCFVKTALISFKKDRNYYNYKFILYNTNAYKSLNKKSISPPATNVASKKIYLKFILFLINLIPFAIPRRAARRRIQGLPPEKLPLKINKDAKCLMVAPHPDDETIGCGGILLHYAKNFDCICVGSSGTPWQNLSAEERADIRIKEFYKVMDEYGIKNRWIFKTLGSNLELEQNMVKSHYQDYFNALDIKKYDYIFMPHPKDNHPIHKFVTNNLMKKIIKKKGHKKNLKIVFYEVWEPMQDVDWYEDISDVALEKYKILRMYESAHVYIKYDKRIEGLNRYRGVFKNNTDYAEAYKIKNVN